MSSLGPGPCPAGEKGEEGPVGPPTLIALIREWIQEDPTLSKHFYFVEYKDGTYIETRCDWGSKQDTRRWPISNDHSGWSVGMVPVEDNPDKRVIIYYHANDDGMRIRGYLRREDPLFFTKLRDFMVLGHDGLFHRTDCKIKWEYGETLSDREEAARRAWWERNLPNL